MKVITKGQVTIPREIREALGIQPGAEVEFKVEGNVVKLIPARKSCTHGRRIVERLGGRATVRISTEEIMALTRGR
jgi:AbrB family looped-hinge helix DNA binding protein